MKIIQALKSVKDLQVKASDLRAKVAQYCADLDCESPTYPDQRRQISEWIQSHSDIVKEVSQLRFRVQKTNIMTNVTIELGGVHITKTIAEWIHRRKDLAKLDGEMYTQLTDKGLRETYQNKLTNNSPETIIKRRLYFDPVDRDNKRELYRSEPSKIDATLEIVNATTDLLEK